MPVYVSPDRANQLKHKKLKKAVTISYLPVNPYSDKAVRIVAAEQAKTNSMKPSDRLKYFKDNGVLETAKGDGMKRYEVTCSNCGEVMGYVFATDAKLTKWRDFHYAQWHDENYWHGCLTPHVSPIDGTLCLECTCGIDTRDFRGNTRLTPQVVSTIEKVNSKGRQWGDISSKYKLKVISDAKFKEVLNGRSNL